MALIFLLVLNISIAEARSVRTAFDRIEEGCGARLKEERLGAKRIEAVCQCVVKNFRNLDLDSASLNLLADSYEDDAKAEEALNQEKWTDLVEKDFAISEGCLDDPKYQFNP